jgi:hypothetical protein
VFVELVEDRLGDDVSIGLEWRAPSATTALAAKQGISSAG